MCNVTESLKSVIFADEMTLFCSGKNLKDLLFDIEKELDVLKAWFDVLKLSFSIYMFLKNK